jgi:coronin-1B/1C/6
VICVYYGDDFTNSRSDGNIRYYEYENDKFEYLTQYTSPNPQRGVAFMPKRGINLHDNEVLRAFKTVNDTYIEPVSFIVPRRSEMFQSDIYPPTTGLRPGTSADEWFGGKTALPPKISLESVYDGGAPKEVPADSLPKASQPAAAAAPKPTPAATIEKPAQSSAPAPVASRGPPPTMNDNKQSLAAGASKFADNDDASDKESESSFEEVTKPVSRSTVTATRQEEKTRGPAISKEPEPTPAKSTSVPTMSASEPGATLKSPEPTPAASAPTSTPAASSGGPASALRDALSDIKSQLEHQNRVMSDQSDQIALLVREVTQLKGKLGTHEPSDREKDERIRQLELELEEARS